MKKGAAHLQYATGWAGTPNLQRNLSDLKRLNLITNSKMPNQFLSVE